MDAKKMSRIVEDLFNERRPRTGKLTPEDAELVVTVIRLKNAAHPERAEPDPVHQEKMRQRLMREFARRYPKTKPQPFFLRPAFRPVLIALAVVLAFLLLAGGIYALVTWLGQPPHTEIVVPTPLPTTPPGGAWQYEQLSATVDLADVAALAARFDLLAGEVTADLGAWIVADGNQMLYIQSNSKGVYQYYNWDVMPATCAEANLTPDQAQQAAIDFGAARDLLPAAYQATVLTATCTVHFVPVVDNLPVAGLYLDVTVGSGGQVGLVDALLPALRRGPAVPLRAAEQALASLRAAGLARAGALEWTPAGTGEIVWGVVSSGTGGDETFTTTTAGPPAAVSTGPLEWPLGGPGTAVTLTGTLRVTLYRGDRGRPWTVYTLLPDTNPAAQPLLVGNVGGLADADLRRVRVWGQVRAEPPAGAFLGEDPTAPIVEVARWEFVRPEEQVRTLLGTVRPYAAWGGAEEQLVAADGTVYALTPPAPYGGPYYEADRLAAASPGDVNPVVVLGRTTGAVSLLSGFPLLEVFERHGDPALAGLTQVADVPEDMRPQSPRAVPLEQALPLGYPRVTVTAVALVYRADPWPYGMAPGEAWPALDVRPYWAFSGTAEAVTATFRVYVDAAVQPVPVAVAPAGSFPAVVDTHALIGRPLAAVAAETTWVLVGEVAAVHPARWDTPDGLPPTRTLACADVVREVEFTVTEQWAGPAVGARVVLAVPGGMVEYEDASGGGTMGAWCAEPQQSFAVGEKVVILARDADGDGRPEVPGAARARWFVDGDNAVATYGLEALPLVELRAEIERWGP